MKFLGVHKDTSFMPFFNPFHICLGHVAYNGQEYLRNDGCARLS